MLTAPPRIGIMQGRLLPPYEGRFQAFPAASWREEFPRARQAGLYCIEWIYEEPHEAENPLGSDDGLSELRQLSRDHGVGVHSICADYYMTKPLVSDARGIDGESVSHLKWLLKRAQMLGVTYIVLPFVDASSIKTPQGRAALVDFFGQIAPHAREAGVELHLESDLPPDLFAGVLQAVNHPSIRWNYDIGNSASLGFDTRHEITTLGPWLGSVHVKDRRRGATTVPLGTGNADLPTAFHMIRQTGFDRWFILQAARGVEGDEVQWNAANRSFVERQVAMLKDA